MIPAVRLARKSLSAERSIGRRIPATWRTRSSSSGRMLYYPLHVEPGTRGVSPAHHFAKGRADPAFRTKLALARELVDAAVQAAVPFWAVVADCFYGEDEAVKRGRRVRGLGYVLALKPSHAWWHRIGAAESTEVIERSGSTDDCQCCVGIKAHAPALLPHPPQESATRR